MSKIPKINEEHEYPRGGQEVVIDVEIRGSIIHMRLTCPLCEGKKLLIAKDHSVMYCGKCGTVMADRCGDYTLDNITWKV